MISNPYRNLVLSVFDRIANEVHVNGLSKAVAREVLKDRLREVSESEAKKLIIIVDEMISECLKETVSSKP